MSPISSFGRRAAAIVLAAAAAVLFVAAPAQAAIPSGSGWSTSWRYYSSTSFEFGATLPGVTAAGYGFDLGGERGALVTLTDTANDDRCARVVMSVPGWGTLGADTVCTAGDSVTVGDFNAKAEGYIYVQIYRTYMFGGGSDKATTLVIPPSKDDPDAAHGQHRRVMEVHVGLVVHVPGPAAERLCHRQRKPPGQQPLGVERGAEDGGRHFRLRVGQDVRPGRLGER